MAVPFTSRSRRKTQGANTNKGFGNTRRGQQKMSRLSGPLGSKPGAHGKGFLSPAPGSAKPGVGGSPSASKPPIVGKSAQPDSIYHGAVDLANRQQESALGSLEGQAQSIRHDFGIDDPTNPFSRAEGLKRAFLARSKAASASLASAGHLYSGAHERALARTRFDEEAARAELRSEFNKAMGQVDSAKTGVKFETEEQKNQAFEDWLARAGDSEAPVAGGSSAALTQPATNASSPTTPKGGNTLDQAIANVKKGGPINVGGAAGVVSPNANANRSIPEPVKNPGGSKQDAVDKLRQQLRQARKNGNQKRVKVLKRRIKATRRGSGYTRG